MIVNAIQRSLRTISSILLAGAFLSISPSLFAGSDTGADFLKIPIGARAVALGQATSALSQGADSLNSNPAGIVSLPTPSSRGYQGGFSFSHQELFLDTRLDSANVVLPARINGKAYNWGFSITRLSFADQEGRDVDRSPTGSFGASDLAVGAALARRLGRFRVGSQVRYIRQELADEQASGVAFDFGVMSPTPISRLSLGASVRNLGPKMEFIREEFDLPLTVSVGGAYQILTPLTLLFDVQSRPHQEQVVFTLGSEFYAARAVTLRAGYLARLAETVTNNQESETNRGNFGGLNGLTAGIGLNLTRLRLDYAISEVGELGATHNFTLSTSFGGPDRPSRADDFADDPKVKPTPEEPTEERTIIQFGE